MNPCPILLNHNAGRVSSSLGEAQLERMARDAGFEAKIYGSRSIGEMRAILRRLIEQGVPRVGVAGGDGTVGAAIQELAHKDTALGILSQGTFNNFATAMRLPHNLPAALRTLFTGRVCKVDLGKVGHRYFTESAGVGLFADGLSLYGRGVNKSLLRGMASVLYLVLSLKTRHLKITVDGKVHHERIVLCEVANTYRIAQGVPIAPDAELTDGHLDIVLLGDLRRRELLEYLRAVRTQLHLDLPKVTLMCAGKEVRIESRRPRNVHCDDQVIGVTPVTITVEPGALNVLVDDVR